MIDATTTTQATATASSVPVPRQHSVGRCPLCMGKGAWKAKRLEVNGTLYLNAKVPCGVCQGSGRWVHVDGKRVIS